MYFACAWFLIGDGSASPKSVVAKSTVSRVSAGSGGESPDSRSVVSATQKSKPAGASDIFGDADDISSSSDSDGDAKMKSDDESKKDKKSDVEEDKTETEVTDLACWL